CGWAFSSDGRPWVAQRVWPVPILPGACSLPSRSSSPLSLPRHLTTRLSPLAAPLHAAALAVVQAADAAGVVAAVFEPPQSIQEDRGGLSFTDVTNDSAHELKNAHGTRFRHGVPEPVFGVAGVAGAVALAGVGLAAGAGLAGAAAG